MPSPTPSANSAELSCASARTGSQNAPWTGHRYRGAGGVVLPLLERAFPGRPVSRRGYAREQGQLHYWFFDSLVLTPGDAGGLLTGDRSGRIQDAEIHVRITPAVVVAGHRDAADRGFLRLLVAPHDARGPVALAYPPGAPQLGTDRLGGIERVHPFETVWSRTISMLPLFLLGFSREADGAARGRHRHLSDFHPCNVRWGYGWIGYGGSPAFHRWHHSSDAAALNKNFSGLLRSTISFGTALSRRMANPRLMVWEASQLPRVLRANCFGLSARSCGTG